MDAKADWQVKRNEIQKSLSEPAKPLTTEELKAGGWWCADVSEEARQAFELRGFNVASRWDLEDIDGCMLADKETAVRFRRLSIAKSLPDITLADGEFYWSEK